MRPLSMADVTPADRVLSAGHPDLIVYRDRLAALTPEDHTAAADRCPVAAEQAIGRTCHLYRLLGEATTHLARAGLPRGRLHRLQRLSQEREATYAGGVEVLAALLGGLYPKHDRPLPIPEVLALVERRVGPMCTGWQADDGELRHSELYPCPIHDTDVSGGPVPLSGSASW